MILMGGRVESTIKKSKINFNGIIIESKFPSANSANSYVNQGGSDYIIKQIIRKLMENNIEKED